MKKEQYKHSALKPLKNTRDNSILKSELLAKTLEVVAASVCVVNSAAKD